MKRFNVICGTEFEVEAFEVDSIAEVHGLSKIRLDHDDHRMRERLAYVIVGSIVIALLIALLIGLHRGSMEPVGLVWSAAALPLGYILKAYFDKQAPP